MFAETTRWEIPASAETRMTLALASIAVSARTRPLIAIEGRAEALLDAFD